MPAYLAITTERAFARPFRSTRSVSLRGCEWHELGLEWSPPEEPSRSRLDEWFLPGRHQALRQRSSPFFPEVHDELTKSWQAPYSSRIHSFASAAQWWVQRKVCFWFPHAHFSARVSDRCDSVQNKTHAFSEREQMSFSASCISVLPLYSQSLKLFLPLAKRAEAWQAIPGVSEWVMAMVRWGYTLQFARRPPRFHRVLATTVRRENAQVLRAEVMNLLEKEAKFSANFFFTKSTDALAYEWPSLPLYSFSPVALLPQVLRQVREQRHKHILIAPLWRNQPRMSELFQLLKAAPWPIPLRRDLLSQANGAIWHPRPELWALHVWLLDGSLSSSRACPKHYGRS